MDGDIPWLYVAMIFIAFVSWIYNQIKEAAEIRREKIAERKRAQRSRMSTEPEYKSPYREQDTASREQVPEGPKSFRDVFKEIERQIQEVEVEVEVEPAPKPPPLPAEKVTLRPTPTVAETPQVSDVSGLGNFPGAGQEKKTRKKRSPGPGAETSNVLRSTLRDGHQLKNALILREILGPPRAKQSRSPRIQ